MQIPAPFRFTALKGLGPTTALAAFLLAFSPGTRAAPADSTTPAQPNAPSEKVLGIGGFFFRSKDPKALSKWYEAHLGVTRAVTDYWRQAGGPTIFQPFPAKTDYFSPPEKQWMINFRVSNLDAMVRQLRAANIDVKVDPTVYPNGRFARLNDPEGNTIELWEEAQPPATGKVSSGG